MHGCLWRGKCSIRLLRSGLIAATLALTAACSGMQDREASVPVVAASAATVSAAPAVQAAPAVESTRPISFPRATASERPLQEDYQALAALLADGPGSDFCQAVADPATSRNELADLVQITVASGFGRLAARFGQTLDRLERIEPDLALAMRGLDLRLDTIDARFASGRDYLLYAIALTALEQACGAANGDDIAFDLFRLVTSREATYGYVFYVAMLPMPERSLDGLVALIEGHARTVGASSAVVATQAWLAAEDTQVQASLSSDSVRVEVDGPLPLAFTETTEVSQSSRIGTANGVVDVGDAITLALQFENAGPSWLYSESVFLASPSGGSGIPDCAMTRSVTGEVVLPELEPGATGLLVLPELFLSDSCVGEQRLEMVVESSRLAVATYWTVALAVSEVTVSLAATEYEEDRPGASVLDSTAGLGDDDVMEFRLLAAGPTDVVGYRLQSASPLPRYGVPYVTLVGGSTIDFEPRAAFESVTVEDLELRAAERSGAAALTPLDETEFVWLDTDVRAKFVSAVDPEPVSRLVAASPEAFDAFVTAYASTLSPLISRVLRAEVGDVTDAAIALTADGTLTGRQATAALAAIDVLRCEGCSDEADDRELGRRLLLVVGAMALIQQGVELGIEPTAFLDRPSLDGIQRLRQRYVAASLRAASYAPVDEEVAATLRALDLTLASTNTDAPLDLYGADYRFRRFLAVPVERR